MRSYHYDYEAEGWADMNMVQRFRLFEDVVFQSTGRKVDAQKMVRMSTHSDSQPNHCTGGTPAGSRSALAGDA